MTKVDLCLYRFFNDAAAARSEITSENAEDLLMLAHRYNAQEFFDECVDFLVAGLNAENVEHLIMLAYRYDAHGFVNNCADFLAANLTPGNLVAAINIAAVVKRPVLTRSAVL